MKKVLAIIFAGVIFTMANALVTSLDISSETVRDNSFMAAQQASDKCGGENISPDLKWSGMPQGAKSLALIVHDPDAPVEHGWYHWIVVDIPVKVTGIAKGAKFAKPAREIATNYGNPGYGGPCPPVGHGVHHYNFTLYALDIKKIKLTPEMKPYEVEAAVKAHAIAQATITGLYERK